MFQLMICVSADNTSCENNCHETAPNVNFSACILFIKNFKLSGPEGPEPALGRLGLVKNTQTRRPPQKPTCSRGYQMMVPPQTQAAAQPRDPWPPSGPGVPGRACVTVLKVTIRTCGQNKSRSASQPASRL